MGAGAGKQEAPFGGDGGKGGVRINEGIDDGHGRRGAELARDLRDVAYELDDEAFGLLIKACDLHTES